ncbi:MAG: hemerythrin domain-containing protein [Rubrivivax sp.]|nr:MAG: hemerythrin domain-containing protein [Rubrivivax sp.]
MSQTNVQPTVTDLIREDHAQVRELFHNYRTDATSTAKQKLVGAASRALETQARLKAEIFYPALRALATDEAALAKSEAEHLQMHSLIGQLRDMRPTATRYDDTVATLVDLFTHHMRDEEAVLLPKAERVLPDELTQLGSQMRSRRQVLSGPSLGQVGTALLAAGGLVAGGYLIKRALDRRV